jgi:tRNA(Ile2) C34 agmatinyltransferase TiaS
MKVKCPRCGYEWDYKGRLQSIQCPSCRRIFRREEAKR